MIGLDIFLVVFSTSHSHFICTQNKIRILIQALRLIRIQANFVDMDPNSC